MAEVADEKIWRLSNTKTLQNGENMNNWTRAELKEKAKEVLHQKYWNMVLAGVLLMLVEGGIPNISYKNNFNFNSSSVGQSGSMSSGLSSMLGMPDLYKVMAIISTVVILAMVMGIVLRIFVTNPFLVGVKGYFCNSLTKETEFGEVLRGFRINYLNVIKVFFLRDLFVYLWSLLLVIPGIIKAYEYRMIPYILAENPHINSEEAFAKSKEMMDGEKWNTFVLDLSFIGWKILQGILFPVGIFWATPYMALTEAALYRRLSGQDRMDVQGYENAGFDNTQYYGASTDTTTAAQDPFGNETKAAWTGSESTAYENIENETPVDTSEQVQGSTPQTPYKGGYFHDEK